MFSYLVGMYIYSRIVSTYLDSLSAPTTTTQTSVVALFNDTDDTQMINHSILSNCLVRITELYSRWQNRKIRCLRCRFLKVRLPQWRRLCRSGVKGEGAPGQYRQTVPNSSSLYTLFYSVIYNSVVRVYHKTVPTVWFLWKVKNKTALAVSLYV